MSLKRLRLLLMLIGLCVGGMACANGASTVIGKHAYDAEQTVNHGDAIIEHMVDAYDWHIMTVGHKHIGVPLPIILYHEGKILSFLSSAFVDSDTHKPVAVLYNKDWERLNAEQAASAAYALAHIQVDPHKGYEIVEVDAQVYVQRGELIHLLDKELPLDFSITKNVVGLLAVAIVFLWVFFTVAKTYTKRDGKAPKGLQSVVEPVIVFVRDDIAKTSIDKKKYERFMPYLLTVFFFILISNLMGLIPILPAGANLTGNIAITGVLALFALVTINVNANKNYWKHIFNTPGVPWFLKYPIPLMPIVELSGLIIKPFVLMVRLFANILAGHIILMAFVTLIFIFGAINIYLGYGVSIVAVLFSVFFSLLELLVAFIQSYVFTLLSAIYIGMAVQDEH